ncbi:betaine--homocysteine S-methyltransferase 1-like [Ruditapes philippinarum]|uniref:betaine--homocysteine S-methyltransferase 1-like n=1 Tax=Ruditapes philippinarum TaxID=129788 RepID=UPI00295BAFFC|nr:betaine--homocysteine S-methyltransferase 1-like [Ruditapes philippinarum]
MKVLHYFDIIVALTRLFGVSKWLWSSRCFSTSTVIPAAKQGLLDRLKDGGSVVIAEGYLWELERRGFLQFGNFLPEVVLEKPEAVEMLHEEFALAGSDVMEAFTYYAHREMMKLRGREKDVERLNRTALSLARKVADKYDKLMAGGLSNTPLYKEHDEDNHQRIYDMFKEQVEWAVEEGAINLLERLFDFVWRGLPAVITIAAHFPDRTTDEVPIPEACKRLEDQGASVVGLNCSRGPDVMMPLIREVKNACKGPIAALPVPYRTTGKQKTFFSVTDPKTGKLVYPDNLDCVRCTRVDIRQFAEDAKAAGIQYIGLCCGNSASLTREVAEVYGKNPPASKYTTNATESFIFGDKVDEEMRKVAKFMKGEIKLIVGLKFFEAMVST